MQRRVWLVAAIVFLALAPNVYHRSLPGPKHACDFTCYTCAGAAMLAGGAPSEVLNPGGTPYNYPPLAGLLLAPFAPLPYTAQGLVWLALSLALCVGCWGECRRLLASLAPAGVPGWLPWAAGLTIVHPLLMTLRFGQINIVVLYTLLLGWRLALEGERGWLAGLALAVPGALKITPTAAALAVLLGQGAGRARSRAWAGFVAGSLALWLALPSALLGWQRNVDYVTTFVHSLPAADVVNWRGVTLGNCQNQCLSNSLRIAARRLAGRPAEPPKDLLREPVPAAAGPLKALLALGLVGAGLGLLRRRTPTAGAVLVGLTCLFGLLATPLAWKHHFVLLLPAALAVPLALVQAGRPRLGQALAWSLTLLVWGSEAAWSHWGALGIGASVWFAVAAVATAGGSGGPAAKRLDKPA